MSLRRCRRGHPWDDGTAAACPSCDLLVLATAPTIDATSPSSPVSLAVDPVVGWLVCVEGPDRGRDWRVRAGRNTVGRGMHMDVRIHGDQSVSRDTHAVVRFDEACATFELSPGPSCRPLTRNGTAVHATVPLRAQDVIGLGRSRLLFVPLCDVRFRWTADAAR